MIDQLCVIALIPLTQLSLFITPLDVQALMCELVHIELRSSPLAKRLFCCYQEPTKIFRHVSNTQTR
ncbi:hypothetical protein EV13_1949 [Prochlorococcus sp. MIT 0702]|nr:hypothetical protein EV13_1949 [Prochlorococcus sp. MIT 0702]KGG28110.1 hypothetical protein EV12_0858 [Prochlorococcus sp. MIT 0701]KGG32811.1 hypothetical protein EV14_1953 [Prochlorococcus sp. MIT 0703]